jgi:hypothetical protein
MNHLFCSLVYDILVQGCNDDLLEYILPFIISGRTLDTVSITTVHPGRCVGRVLHVPFSLKSVSTIYLDVDDNC